MQKLILNGFRDDQFKRELYIAAWRGDAMLFEDLESGVSEEFLSELADNNEDFRINETPDHFDKTIEDMRERINS